MPPCWRRVSATAKVNRTTALLSRKSGVESTPKLRRGSPYAFWAQQTPPIRHCDLPSNREFAGDGGSVAVSIKLKQSMFQDHCLNKEQGIFERENRETLFKTGKRFWFIAQAGPERTPKVSNLD